MVVALKTLILKPLILKQRVTINQDDRIESIITTDGCKNTVDEVKYIEQVEFVVTILTSNRGGLEINITSPGGTKSLLLSVGLHFNKDISLFLYFTNFLET